MPRKCVTGLASVMPYPCMTLTLSRWCTAASRSAPNGAAPDTTSRSFDRSYWATRGCLASPRMIGGTRMALVIAYFCKVPRNCSMSKRGIVTTVAPL